MESIGTESMKGHRHEVRKGSHMTQMKAPTNLSVNEYYKNITMMRNSNASSKLTTKEDLNHRVAS